MNLKNKDINKRKVLTNSEYWDSNWKRMDIASSLKMKDHFYKCFQQMVKKKLKLGKKTLLEVGCAPGRFLVYFVREFDYDISGIDYSKIGCELTRNNLYIAGKNGHIIEADLLSDSLPKENWDIVFSAGLVEHFLDPKTILMKKYELLKPGGVLLTTIPNFAGFTGLIRKVMTKEVYLKHNPISGDDLFNIYRSLGLQNIDVGYFASLRLAFPKPYSPFFVKKVIWLTAMVLDKVLVSAYKITNRSIEGAWASSHIYAYGVKSD